MTAASYPKHQARRWPGPARARPIRARARRAAWLVTAAVATACHTTPVTGRQSLNAFSTAYDIELGREAYEQVLAEAQLITTGPRHDMVVRVMTRLSSVADDPGFEWEVNLIQGDKTVNAFALPGGKMAVYTGLLPVCANETGLAVVMGHEIGHVVARHGTERMMSSFGLDWVLSMLHLGDAATLAQMSLDLFIGLPFGRVQETEADEIGLVYMAMAGYDPREAISFWQRMESQSGSQPLELLSTHPSNESRIEHLRAKLPAALAIWRAAVGGASR